MSCFICESTEKVIKPSCCRENFNICRKCIEKVDKCPHCRCEKQNNNSIIKQEKEQRYKIDCQYQMDRYEMELNYLNELKEIIFKILNWV